MTPEVAQLLATLEDQRAGALKKLAGLSEEDARRSTVPSGTNVAGLIQHLTFVEGKWLGGQPDRGLRSMTVDPSVTLRELRARYRAACDASNEFIRSRVADAKLRNAILVVIQETARHAGHADIIREQIDGQTGR